MASRALCCSNLTCARSFENQRGWSFLLPTLQALKTPLFRLRFCGCLLLHLIHCIALSFRLRSGRKSCWVIGQSLTIHLTFGDGFWLVMLCLFQHRALRGIGSVANSVACRGPPSLQLCCATRCNSGIYEAGNLAVRNLSNAILSICFQPKGLDST